MSLKKVCTEVTGDKTAGLQPGMFSGMGDMVQEMSKLKGVPVSQTMRMGTTIDGSPYQPPQNRPCRNTPSSGSIAGKAASGAATSASDTAAASAESKATSRMGNFGGIASGLGDFGGFHKKKPKTEEPTPAAATPPADAAPQSAVLIESTTEMHKKGSLVFMVGCERRALGRIDLRPGSFFSGQAFGTAFLRR
jgi:hypothetical protein